MANTTPITSKPDADAGCAESSGSASSELWKACAQVIREEGKPLEIWRVAKATGQTEGEVIAALIRESRGDRTVTFRFPPLPRAAIMNIEMPNASGEPRGE